MKKLVLSHHRSPGDSLVLSAAIRSLHLTYPGEYLVDLDVTARDDLYTNSPDVTRLDRREAKFHPIEYPLIDRCNQEPVHFMEAFTRDLSRIIGRPLTLKVLRPVLLLRAEEKEWRGRVEEIAGQKVPYALINCGGKRDFTCKHVGATIAQEVVDHFRGRIQFVQIGQSNEVHPPLRGVIDQIDRTTVRELIRLAYHARFAIGPSTLLQHVCGALGTPYVAVLGGREPRPWSSYPTQREVTMQGALKCCQGGSCWKSRAVALNDGSEMDKSLCLLPVLQGGGEWVPACVAMPGSKAIIHEVEILQYGLLSQGGR